MYKARDTRLNRTVAIKVLRPALVADPAGRARFEREARAISALDHPNICVLHDVGEDGGVEYLVMQHLEGETLAARLARGAIPVDEALRYAIDIAAALDRAHRAGILHRDLKPGNIMLARSGRETTAKLLDFGLAKLAPAGGPAASLHTELTVTSPLTGQGSILGTLLYMSPEQLQGVEIDARSDIFSFGAVLYEMVTGVRAFAGSSQASIIGAILEREPAPLATHAPLTPPALDRVVRKCLAKDPERRWQSAADLRDELAWIAESASFEKSGSMQGPRPSVQTRLPASVLTAAGVVILALTSGLAWMLYRGTQAAPATPGLRLLSIAVPQGTRLAPGGVAISPDGKTLVYAATPDAALDSPRPSTVTSSARLYIRRFDTNETTVVPGSDGARAPFFSPDGTMIAFFTEFKLLKLSLVDGSIVKIGDVPPVTRGGTWLSADTIILAPTQTSGLVVLSATDGKLAEPVTQPDLAGGEKGHMWPVALPDGRVLYSIRRGTPSNEDEADLAIFDPVTKKSVVILQRAAYGRYSSTGQLLFVRGRSLMTADFDLEKTEVRSAPRRIADTVATHPWLGGGHLAVGPDGTVVVAHGSWGSVKTSSFWVDRSGHPLAAPRFSQSELGKPRISPDGSRAVFDGVSEQGDNEIYIADLARGTTVRFTTDPEDDFNPIWTADGRRIIWTTLPTAKQPTLVWRAADGTGSTEAISPDGRPQFAGSVSIDNVLAFAQWTGERGTDIWVVPLTGERKPRRLVGTPAAEFGPEFSPDGKWIAYVSNESGTRDVYVVPFPGPGEKRRVTTGGGAAVAWSRDGRELYYQSEDRLMAIPVLDATEMRLGEPQMLFKGNFVTNARDDGPREYRRRARRQAIPHGAVGKDLGAASVARRVVALVAHGT